MNTRALTLAVSVLAMSLSACSRSPDGSPADDEEITATATTVPPLSDARDSSASMPSLSSDINATDDVPPLTEPSNSFGEGTAEEPIAPLVNQQVMDDATAAGMTSRTPRGEPGSDDSPLSQDEPK